MRPRFSVVLPVRNRADVVGRSVAGVLAQTFGRLELVVVDDGSTDDSMRIARSVGDRRVRIVSAEQGGDGPAWQVGVASARGRFVTVLSVDDEVEPCWLARIGQLADATGAVAIGCGGTQRHRDGTLTTLTAGGARTGALVLERRLVQELEPRLDTHEAHLARAVERAEERGSVVVRTPEPLVRWNDPVEHVDGEPEQTAVGPRAQLVAAQQALDALARSPIPDEALLSRYATTAGIAAVQLGEFRTARRMFALARSSRPDVARHWARWLVACVPPVAVRIWPLEDTERPDDAARPEPIESVRSLASAHR